MKKKKSPTSASPTASFWALELCLLQNILSGKGQQVYSALMPNIQMTIHMQHLPIQTWWSCGCNKGLEVKNKNPNPTPSAFLFSSPCLTVQTCRAETFTLPVGQCMNALGYWSHEKSWCTVRLVHKGHYSKKDNPVQMPLIWKNIFSEDAFTT